MVQISVWNLSNKTQLVYPISPVTYILSFRDETGKDITSKIYCMPPILPPLIDISELSRIEPGNCIATNYLLPNFYQNIKSLNSKKIECQINICLNYIVNRKKWRLSTFKLSSDWIEIPPP